MKQIGWGSFVLSVRSLRTWRATLTLSAAFACAFVFMACRGAAAQVPVVPSESAITIERALFTQSPSVSIPRDANWQSVTLPDSWRMQKRDRRNGYGWYRIAFRYTPPPDTAPAEVESLAIMIPRITNNIEVFLNGASFGISGRLGPVPEESWNLAQYFLLPSSLLKQGDNELAIRLHPDGYARAGISAITLGEAREVRAAHSARYFIQTTAPQLITAVLIVMCAFSFVVWARRRSETLFLLFALMSLAAVLRLFHHYLRDVPTFVALLAVPAMCWMVAFQVTFSLHFANRSMPRFEKGLFGFAAIATLGLVVTAFLGSVSTYLQATTVVYAAMAVLTPLLAAVMIYQLTREPSWRNALMVLAVLGNSAFGIHDYLNFREVLGYDQLYLIPLGLPLLLVAMAALLVRRFLDTLNDYEALNAGLANRVFERERDLEQAFARERLLDQQRATAEERQRLMRDMHDGLGGHLMSSLALMKRGQLSQAALETLLADCIDELKLTIDSLEPVERDLLVVLGNLRYRLEPRLNAAGISLEWAVTDLPPLDYLEPDKVREILLIVQEAFTNTLKHANATRITLSTAVDRAANSVLVRITDDGRTFDQERARSGRGLANMRNRATRLRGAVEILPLKGGGTCVNLHLPMRVVS